MKKILEFQFLKPLEPFFLLPVRIALGWIFIAHGGQKLFGWWGGHGLYGVASFMETMGLKPGIVWAVLAAGGEFFGALMVLFGFYARFGAFLLTAVMAVAIWKVHATHGFFLSNQGFEYNVAILGLSLCILLKGSGPYSLRQDH